MSEQNTVHTTTVREPKVSTRTHEVKHNVGWITWVTGTLVLICILLFAAWLFNRDAFADRIANPVQEAASEVSNTIEEVIDTASQPIENLIEDANVVIEGAPSQTTVTGGETQVSVSGGSSEVRIPMPDLGIFATVDMVTALRQDNDARFENIEMRVANLETTSEKHAGMFDIVEQKFGEVDGRLDDIDDTLVDFALKFEQQEKANEEFRLALAELENVKAQLVALTVTVTVKEERQAVVVGKHPCTIRSERHFPNASRAVLVPGKSRGCVYVEWYKPYVAKAIERREHAVTRTRTKRQQVAGRTYGSRNYCLKPNGTATKYGRPVGSPDYRGNNGKYYRKCAHVRTALVKGSSARRSREVVRHSTPRTKAVRQNTKRIGAVCKEAGGVTYIWQKKLHKGKHEVFCLALTTPYVSGGGSSSGVRGGSIATTSGHGRTAPVQGTRDTGGTTHPSDDRSAPDAGTR